MAKKQQPKVSRSPRKARGGTTNHSVYQFFTETTGMTDNQSVAIKEWRSGKNLIMSGYAGTGKTYLAINLACEELISKRVSRLLIVRSAVPTRDIGFLPGTAAEKLSIYEAPYGPVLSDIFQRGDAMLELKDKGVLKIESTSFLRGMTFDDTVIVVDECQNMTFHEINTIMTRLGEGSRIIFSGDIRQADIKGSGIERFMSIIHRMDPSYFAKIDFSANDIVRSGIVKDYILAMEGM